MKAPRRGSPSRSTLDQTLVELVGEGVLTDQQATAVGQRLRERGLAGVAAGPDPADQTIRQRLIEAAFYLGVACVVTAVVVLIAQRWSSFGRSGQIALTTTVALAALAIGAVIARSVRPDLAGTPAGGLRRRAGSALLVAGALVAAADVSLILDSRDWSQLWGAATAVALLALGHLLAPTLLGELALAVAATFLATSIADVLFRPGADAEPQDWQRRQVLFALPPIAMGAAWAWWMSGWLRHRILAISWGLAVMVLFALTMLGEQRAPASIALIVIAVAALISYLREPLWPWLVATIVAVAAVVFIQAGEPSGLRWRSCWPGWCCWPASAR